jgi:hypothetical protein
MTPTRLKDLAASAANKRLRSERDINRWLQEQGISDPETRIGLKVQLMAQGALATDQAGPYGRLATEDVAYRPGLSEMDRLLVKLGTDLSSYQGLTERELDDKLTTAGITDPERRIAIKHELVTRRLIPQPRPTLRATRNMTAAAERPQGKVLLDPRTGQPAVLQSQPV